MAWVRTCSDCKYRIYVVTATQCGRCGSTALDKGHHETTEERAERLKKAKQLMAAVLGHAEV